MESKLQGEVVYLYAFDVADEIRTERINKILSKKATPLEIQPDRTLPKNLPFYRPLTIDPKRDSWKMSGVQVQTVVRIYDVGVVSIVISVPFKAENLQDLIPYHQPVLDNQHDLDKAAHELCRDVVHNLREYLVRGIPNVDIPEAYTIFSLHHISGISVIDPWVKERRREIAGLLSETPPELLSDQQVEETFRHSLSFDRDDRTIIDWDASLVINLSGKTDDEIHVLELANLQLEELVLMDKRIDNYVNQAYEELEKKRIKFLGLRGGAIEKLRRFRMDVTKITDEVSNISKFFGDWYLARIYLSAQERFHISTWRESIQDRLNNLDNLYETLHAEANEARMLLLEIMIVLLFIIDLIAVIWIKK